MIYYREPLRVISVLVLWGVVGSSSAWAEPAAQADEQASETAVSIEEPDTAPREEVATAPKEVAATAPKEVAATAPKEVADTDIPVITVTAQKREENVQKVPISVAVVSDEKLALIRGGGRDIRMLAGRVPSLNVESSFGRTFPRFYIRGLGNTDFDLNASQPVSLIVDDVYLENPAVKSFPLFDVAQIEVLRGPQGTLFGRNTPAGAIKIETAKPTEELELALRTSGGERGFFGVEMSASGALVENVLSARVSTLVERQSDWIDNILTPESNDLGGFTQMAARLQFLLTPSDRIQALVNVHAHELRGTARIFHGNSIEPGTDQLVDDFKRDEVAFDGKNEQELSQWGASVRLDVDLGALKLTSISAYEYAEIYQQGDIDGNHPLDENHFSSETADAIPETHQFTQELRLATQNWDTFGVQVGTYYFYEDLAISSYSFNSLENSSQNGFAEQEQTTHAFAVFGSASYQPIPILKLQAGIRWSHDEKTFTASRLLSPLAFLGIGPIGPIRANPSTDFVSGDFSASLLLGDAWTIYHRTARGFRAPSIQGRLLFGDEVYVADEESILSFELGVKSQPLSWLRANLSGYYYIMNDQQLTAVGGDSNVNRLLNADETVGYGIEFETTARPVKGLLISGGLSFNKTRINSDGLGVAPCATCTVLDPPLSADSNLVNIDGNSLANAPEIMAQLDVRYGYTIGGEHEAYIFTDWAYRSRTRFFLYESVEFEDDGILEGGLRLGFRRLDERYDLAGVVRNILNDTSRTGGIDFANLTSFVNPPRYFGVELRMRLN